MQIFQFRGGVIGDYAEYITSFINLADPRIKQTVQESLVAGLLWRDPLVQINLLARASLTLFLSSITFCVSAPAKGHKRSSFIP
jgi:hypothetical protein